MATSVAPRADSHDPRRREALPDTAIVLAGGLGTRLRPAVSDRPKVLAQAAGRPFLHYVLAYLSAQGVAEVILSVGYLADQVREFAQDGRRWKLDIRYCEERKPLGTGGALRLASRELSGPFIALNGDTLFTADLQALWKTHTSEHAAATIALLSVLEGKERGCVTLAENGQILSFNEKPTQVGPALVNGGVYILDTAALDSVPDGRPVSIEREVFPRLAAEGRLYGLMQPGYFADIGTPESLAAFEEDVMANRLPDIANQVDRDVRRTC